jgi:hypothetical protein
VPLWTWRTFREAVVLVRVLHAGAAQPGPGSFGSYGRYNDPDCQTI